MKAQFKMLADYNAWANERLYDAAAALADSDYRADLGAFFGSINGTLNHLLVGDRIWMRRFTGEGDAPAALDAILYDDFAQLRRARRAEDARIIAYVDRLTEPDLEATLSYRSTRSPAELAQQLAAVLLHFFNHQTHHRGQAHCLLTRLSGEAPSLDLLVYQRQSGAGFVSGAGGSFSEPERRPATCSTPPSR
jgi:uncharacterized damage-inducible protein DinB